MNSRAWLEKMILFQFPDAGSCQDNYIKFYDGSSSSSTLLQTFCDSYPPIHFMTSSNEAYVKLVTDGKMVRPVFSANYQKSKNALQVQHLTQKLTLLFPANCTYVLNQASGDILMPDYPDGYTGAQECHWHITVTAGYLVGVMFQSLEVKPSSYEHKITKNTSTQLVILRLTTILTVSTITSPSTTALTTLRQWLTPSAGHRDYPMPWRAQTKFTSSSQQMDCVPDQALLPDSKKVSS